MDALKQIAPQSVQALRGHRANDIRQAAEVCGHKVVNIDGKACPNKAAVLKAIADAFHFPAHFGGNLDALYDCLTDLHGVQGKGYVVLLEDLPLSSGFDAEERQALIDVFRDAADAHGESGMPFRVFYSLAD